VGFGRKAPLEADLGCGRGDYALQRAVQFPNVNMVALEVRKKWIAHVRDRCRTTGIKNLRAIRCDVTQDLPMLFHERSVSAFTIHHPDPWWKKRHRKRRLIQTSFVEMASRLLIWEGWIFVQTDVSDLADEVQDAFSKHPFFVPADADAWKNNVMGGLRSHREAKCIKLGIPIYRMVYVLKQTGNEKP
jgi:tRNA (guanine-N7-)-methyltransferase